MSLPGRDAGVPSATATPRSSGAEAERRQLTVMFCDLVGSTELSGRLDPEELRDVVRQYHARAGEQIERYGGHVAQHLGDGLVVYFGFPAAHEDDAKRAVLAGLGILEAIADLDRSLHQPGVDLAVRIGVHTGLVVAGEMGAGETRERLALGQTPNIAARIQALAEPGTLLLSGATRSIVRHSIALEPLGSQQLRGVDEPVTIWRVSQSHEPRHSVAPTAAPGAGPIIGRREELATLLGRFTAARSGHGQVVQLSAEAGVGKSRLVQAFLVAVEAEPHQSLLARCLPYEAMTAFSPLIDLLQRLCGFRPGDTDDHRIAKLEALLKSAGLEPDAALAALADLLSLDLGDRFPASALSGQRQKDRTLDVLWQTVCGLAERTPVLLVLEDLQWADASTLEFLDLLLPQLATEPILCLLTSRPPCVDPWPSGNVTRITLERLDVQQVEELVLATCGGKSMPPEVLRQLIDKTDGVPLFVEEMTKAILESGSLAEGESSYELAQELEAPSVPATLQGSLTARLDRLSSVKDLALLASVLGREFSYRLLAAVAESDEQALQLDLQRLVDAELLYQRGSPPNATYVFKHALIRDAAYELLLRRTRQEYHGRVAGTLLAKFPRQAARRPELVAQHYTAANDGETAIHYWLAAGQRALERAANTEAAHHAENGLRLLGGLERRPEVDQWELALQMSLAQALTFTRGYVAPEVESAFVRAQQLCAELPGSPDLFWVLLGISFFHIVRGELDIAHRISLRLLDIAVSQKDANLESFAHNNLACSSYFMAEFEAARGHCERAMALATPGDYSYRDRTGVDIQVSNNYFAALVLWHLGEPEQARRHAETCLAVARAQQHPYSLAAALIFSGVELGYCEGDAELVAGLAQEVVSLSQEHGFGHWALLGSLPGCWAQIRLATSSADGAADVDVAVTADSMMATLEVFRGTGMRLKLPYLLSLAGESMAVAGRVDAALSLIDEGIGISEAGSDRFWQAELYRLRGALKLERSESAEAEACFRQALETARRQGSKALEKRAARSLARLWQRQGRSDEASALADLSEAEELGRAGAAAVTDRRQE